jgi:hypothetical protein
MSADNYYLVGKHPLGGYAVEMGFASDDEVPEITEKSLRFETLREAELYESEHYAEYGFHYTEEVQKELK